MTERAPPTLALSAKGVHSLCAAIQTRANVASHQEMRSRYPHTPAPFGCDWWEMTVAAAVTPTSTLMQPATSVCSPGLRSPLRRGQHNMRPTTPRVAAALALLFFVSSPQGSTGVLVIKGGDAPCCAPVCKDSQGNCYYTDQCKDIVPGLRKPPFPAGNIKDYNFYYKSSSSKRQHYCKTAPPCDSCTDSACGAGKLKDSCDLRAQVLAYVDCRDQPDSTCLGDQQSGWTRFTCACVTTPAPTPPHHHRVVFSWSLWRLSCSAAPVVSTSAAGLQSCAAAPLGSS